MTELLLIVNLVLLMISAFLFNKITRNYIIAVLYGAYTSIFIGVVPAAYIAGFDFLSIPDTYKIYLLYYEAGDLIFILASILIFFIFGLTHLNLLKLIPRYLKINNINKLDVIVVSLIFFVISYLSLAHMDGSFFYFFKHYNQFQEVQRIKKGGWVFVVLSSCYLYPFILLVSRLSKGPNSAIQLTFLLVAFIASSIFIFKTQDRSELIIYILILFIARMNEKNLHPRFRLRSFVSMFVLLMLMLYVLIIGNQWRMGVLSFLPSKSILIQFVPNMLTNFLQVENDLALIHFFSIHQYIGYKYLGLVASGYALLPSILLPFHKINTGLEHILTLKIFGETLPPMYSPNSTLTFTIPFTGYAEGGFIGAAISSIIYSIFLSLAGLTYKLSNGINRIFFNFVLLNIIIGFRLSLESIIILLYVNLMFYLIIAIIKIFIRIPG